MKPIRVLRLLEYIYDSPETMERDMALWGAQRHFATTHMVVRSATLPMEVLPTPGAPDLLAALRPFAEENADLTDAACHRGLTTAEECARCSKVLAARAAIASAEGKTP